MGKPVLESPIALTVMGKAYTGIPVSMGNPHMVVFQEEIADLPLETIGVYFECCDYFPNRVNTEFAKFIDRRTLQMRVWERGSGETMACGSGACAVATAAFAAGMIEREVTVRLLGGDLKIRIDEETGHVFMTGPAVTVFEGVLF